MLAGCRPEVVLDGMGTRKRATSSMARTKRMQVTIPAPGPGDRSILHEPQLPTLPRAAGTTLRLDSAAARSDRLRLPSWRSCAHLEFSRLRHERRLAGATSATSLAGRQGQASGRKPIITWRAADSREGCQEIGPVQYAAGTSKSGAGQRIFGLKAAPLASYGLQKVRVTRQGWGSTLIVRSHWGRRTWWAFRASWGGAIRSRLSFSRTWRSSRATAVSRSRIFIAVRVLRGGAQLV